MESHESRPCRIRRTIVNALAPIVESLDPRRLMSAGDLDFSFSGDGMNTVDLPGMSGEIANASVVLGDGKILLAGRATVGGETDFFVAKLLESGGVDTTFGGGDGVVSIDFQVNDEAMDLAIDGGGRIVVVGTSSSGAGSNARQFAVARVNSNGTLDGTFSGDGKTTVDFGINADAQAVAIDGASIYVGGYKDLGTTGQFALVRLLATGAQDTTYSTDGEVFFGFGANNDSRSYDIAIDSLSRVVMVGYDEALAGSTARNFAYARVGTNALLDPTFSGDGLAVTDFTAGSDDEARSVNIDTKGNWVVGGFTDGTGGDDFAATRISDTGSLDSTFSGDGKFQLNLGGVEQVDELVVHPDNDITLSGMTSTGAFQAALVRVSAANGGLSTTFGDDGNGIQLIDFGGIDDGFTISLDQRDLRAIVAGTDGGGRLAVARVHDLIDQNFTSTHGGQRIVLPDDRILIFTSDAVRRILPNGAIDTGFGVGGVASLPTFPGGHNYEDMAVDSQGRIVVVGDDFREWKVVRLSSNGVIDTSFSTDGVAEVIFGLTTSLSDNAFGIAIDAADRPVVVGSAGGILGEDFAAARLTTNGLLDNTFDGDGKVSYELGIGNDRARSVLIQPDGQIVLVGDAQRVSGFEWAAMRLNPDGSKDLTFGFLGDRIVDAGGSGDNATDVAIDAAGRLFVVGETGNTTNPGTGVATIMAFNSDGSDATSFSADGVRHFDLPVGSEFHSVAVQPDGKVVATGRLNLASGPLQMIARMNSDGSDDSTFAGDGLYVLPKPTGPIDEDLTDVGGAYYVGSALPVRLNVQPEAVDGQLLFETGPQRLQVSFNDDIGASLGNFDFSIRNDTANSTLSTSAYALEPFDGLNNQVTISFNSILADGNYTAAFSSSGIRNNQNMVLAGDREKEFFFLNGDANRDRIVNISDFAILAARFNQPGTFSQGNFNYAGNVDISDFAILASQFNKSMPAPAELPRAAEGGAASKVSARVAYAGNAFALDRVFSQLVI